MTSHWVGHSILPGLGEGEPPGLSAMCLKENPLYYPERKVTAGIAHVKDLKDP